MTTNREQLLTALCEANERQGSDEDVALLAVDFIIRSNLVDPIPVTLARAMLMLAARRVTPERAEMLLQELLDRGLIEEEPDQSDYESAGR